MIEVIVYLIVYSPFITLVALFTVSPPLAITLALVNHFALEHFLVLTDDDYKFLQEIVKEDK